MRRRVKDVCGRTSLAQLIFGLGAGMSGYRRENPTSMVLASSVLALSLALHKDEPQWPHLELNAVGRTAEAFRRREVSVTLLLE